MSRIVLCALVLPLACADASEAALFELHERQASALEGAPVIPYGAQWREAAVVVEPDDEAEAELDEVADSAPWPTHPGQPHVVVGRWLGAVAEDDDLRGSARCPFEVTTRGFPAIADDGRTIVGVSRGTWSASDGEDEVLVVRWHDVDRDAVVDSKVVFDGDDGTLDFDDPSAHCRPMWRAAKRAAAEINARLAAESWRTLDYVGIHARDEVAPWDEPDEEQVPLPAATRAVELAHFGKQAALRIRGVQVLHRAAVEWLGTESWPCMLDPNVLAVLGDRETGTLAVFVDHQTGGCLCYSEIELHALRVPDAIFAEAARRPTPQYVPSLVQESTE